MMSQQSMSVDIWAGDWGLPTVDLDCLRVMAYSRFSGAPLQFRVVGSPFMSPNGKLPVFRHGRVALTQFNEIVEHLKKKNFYADVRLTEQQLAEAESYTAHLEYKLLPALLYTWWLDEKNYTGLTRPWYASHLSLPFNYYYPGRYEREARSRIQACFEHEENDLETHIYSEAEKCLNALSARLGEYDYYMGSLPTSLDATVFAYLVPLLRAPFPSARLQNFLKSSPNLVKFCIRIEQGYFASTYKEFEGKIPQPSEESTTSKTSKTEDAHEQYREQVRSWVLAGATATVALLTFMFSHGTLKLCLPPPGKVEKFNLDEDYDPMIFMNKNKR